MNDSTERWHKLEDLFQAALGCSPAERASFLNRACPDEELRREVESLLDAKGNGDKMLDGTALRYAFRTLEPGASIGVYRIEVRIGQGGMGEVYRATDTRLHRAAAIKVLPAEYANDAEWLARFKREARVLASLNHPNIAAIYGLEESGQVLALAMELVEGTTLAERLARGRLPLENALDAAKQIAEALEYAHERGVVHRDLKPANIKITSESNVKVLDFGLAKVVTPGEDSPTLTATCAGAILGTPAYMPPEQANGMPVDKRADIWSFGVVLFEMLTGRQVFAGTTAAGLLAAVMRDEPRWEELSEGTPTAIRHLLRRCLEKDPKRRLRDIGEARITIDEAQNPKPEEAAANHRPRAIRLLSAAVVALCLVLAGALIWIAGWFQHYPVPLGAAHFTVGFPAGTGPWSGPDLPNIVPSPDGKQLAMIAESNGVNYLWVRALDSGVARRIDHTEGAHEPFWSPDGKSIGFFAESQLRRVSLGGDPKTIISRVGVGNGGTWNADGVIVFSPGERMVRFGTHKAPGLMRVPEAGGEAALVTRVDPALAEAAHAWPQFLPDGKHFLYFAYTGPSNGAIYVQDLDSGKRTLVLKTPWRAVYSSGHLLFVRPQGLFAQPFDLAHFRLRGEPAPLVGNINVNQYSVEASFSASNNGVLAYRFDDVPPVLKQLAWYDRSGKSVSTVGATADYSNPALAPDGNWLAVGIANRESGNRDIWLLDLARGSRSRLTSDPADNLNPVWSPDGKRVAFSSNRRGFRDIYIKDAFGTTAEEMVVESPFNKGVEDWSPDGRWIMFNTATPQPEHISLFSLETRNTQSYTSGEGDHSRFSPDGKWVAYQTVESSHYEVWIEPFPATSAKWQISTAGGNGPQWRGDGKELFYVDDSRPPKLMAVDMAVKDGAIHAGLPHPLFSLELEGVNRRNEWLVTLNGQKFLALVPQKREPPVISLSVIYNWPALFENK